MTGRFITIFIPLPLLTQRKNCTATKSTKRHENSEEMLVEKDDQFSGNEIGLRVLYLSFWCVFAFLVAIPSFLRKSGFQFEIGITELYAQIGIASKIAVASSAASVWRDGSLLRWRVNE